MDYEGTDLIELMSSDVFKYTFEFDHWPGVHSNTEKLIKPYNGSIFDLRTAYEKLFPEIESDNKDAETDKLYKITYTSPRLGR